MAIDPVPGYGQITSSNAKEIYAAYRRGDVDLNAAQRKRTESFLTNEDFDEIDYNSDVAKKDGKNQLGDDVKNAESHGGQGGNATAATAGNAASIAGTIALSYVALGADGFTAAILAAAAIVCAGMSILFSSLFDNGFHDRTDAEGNADTTNQIIDDNKNVLEESMGAMNDDMDTYKEQSDQYTKDVNDATANAAALEAQIADAEAAGDIDGVKNLKEELKRTKDDKRLEGQLEGMQETKDMLEEYAYANEMALGVGEGGQTVSDFLKEGTALGVVATVNTALLTAATIAMTLAATGHMPKLAPLFFDTPMSTVAKVLYYGAGAMFGISAGIMSNKMTKEFQCGSAGREMQEHVNDLTDMAEQQEGYMETTTEGYDETDEKSSKSQDKAKEAAAKSNQNRNAGVGPVNNKKKQDEQETAKTGPDNNSNKNA